MPWVVTCFDLLAPILGYCLAIRKLALQAGIFQEENNKSIIRQAANSSNTSKKNSLSSETMAPSAEEQRQGKMIKWNTSNISFFLLVLFTRVTFDRLFNSILNLIAKYLKRTQFSHRENIKLHIKRQLHIYKCKFNKKFLNMIFNFIICLFDIFLHKFYISYLFSCFFLRISFFFIFQKIKL